VTLGLSLNIGLPISNTMGPNVWCEVSYTCKVTSNLHSLGLVISEYRTAAIAQPLGHWPSLFYSDMGHTISKLFKFAVSKITYILLTGTLFAEKKT